MSKFKKLKTKIVNKTVRFILSSLSQETTKEGEPAEISAEMIDICRKVSAESMVLLKNDNNALPFIKDERISVFGRVQNDYFYVGYGSGGDVKAPYKVSPIEALENDENVKINKHLSEIYKKWSIKNPVDDGFWGHWPMHYEEMPIDDAIVKSALKYSDSAVIMIGRASGEDRENTLTKGSYYLTEAEEDLLDKVTTQFNKTVVVLNIGNIIDLSWIKRYKISSVLIAWQGGMESGNAMVDILTGKATPSGKLTATIANNYNDYESAKDFGKKLYNNYAEDIYVGYRYFETFCKDKVLYPFGFGLSYTNFNVDNVKTMVNDNKIIVKLDVTNAGANFSGKEVIQIYYSAPQGKLGKPSLNLASFCKTNLLKVGQSQTLTTSFKVSDMASYDDEGVTGHKSAYVLEKGVYTVFYGTSINNIKKCKEIIIDDTIVVKQLEEVSAVQPKHKFNRLKASIKGGNVVKSYDFVPTRTVSLKDTILKNLPKETPITNDVGIKLIDVKNGKASIDDFVAQLSLDELEAITRGDYIMNSPLGSKGNAGVFGGVLPSLREKGIPPITTTDGPSGIRLLACSSLLPIGTAMACTWNYDIIKEVYKMVAFEMKERKSDILLAPGMNIHRNVLCGRNFEYFSEDPLLTGVIASAVVDGLQSNGVSACVKHFACNNQEKWRPLNDSRVSERALREIYLKGFEICIKLSNPYNVMTSYNKINGVWGHYNYDLCTTILRKEWGYNGNVITDWWMRSSKSPEFPKLKNQAYRVRAQVDVLMPGGKRIGKKIPDGTLLKTLGKADGITLGELQRSAKNVLNYIIVSNKI